MKKAIEESNYDITEDNTILGLTPFQTSVLIYIASHPGTTMHEIERVLDARQPIISLTVMELRRVGLIFAKERFNAGSTGRRTKLLYTVFNIVCLLHGENEKHYNRMISKVDSIKDLLNEEKTKRDNM